MKENIPVSQPPPPPRPPIARNLKKLRAKRYQTALIGIVIFAVCTILLASVVYFWTVGYFGAGYGMAPEAFAGEVPAEPKAMSINSTLNVEYVRIEQDYVATYTLDYDAFYIYKTTYNTTAYLPLPTGSVEDLVLKLNNKVIGEPNITGKSIIVALPAGTSNVYLSYSAKGSGEYSHSVPKNRLVEKFWMKLEVKNVEYKEALSSECLMPDIIHSSDKTTTFEWDKENAILDKDIVIKIPKWENPFDAYLNGLPALFILVIILGLFYYEAFRRVGIEWKSEYIGFLLVPFIFLYLSLGVLIVYTELIFAALASLAFG